MSDRSWKMRILALSGLTLAIFLALALVSRDTYALYSARAVSGDNSIRGGSIELTLVPKEGDPSGTDTKNDGKNALRYDVRLVTAGDADFCGVLHLSVMRGGSEVYSGLFGDFVDVSGGPLASGEDEDWGFVISIPDTVVPGENELSCQTSFLFRAWQAPYDMPTGWTDEETFVGPDTVLTPAGTASPDTLESLLVLPLVEEPSSADAAVETGTEEDLPVEESVTPAETVPVVPEIVPGPPEEEVTSTNDSVTDPEGNSLSSLESPETELP